MTAAAKPKTTPPTPIPVCPLDGWIEGGGMTGTRGKHCRYCGSMEADAFLDAVLNDPHALLIPTKSNDNAWVDNGEHYDEVRFHHLSDHDQATLLNGIATGRVDFGAPGTWIVLPYFAMHLHPPVAATPQ